MHTDKFQSDKHFTVTEDNGLLFSRKGETVRIEPWGENSLRIRASLNNGLHDPDWALLPPAEKNAVIEVDQEQTVITNGDIQGRISADGRISMVNTSNGETILEEMPPLSNRVVLEYPGRHYRFLHGDNYRLRLSYATDPDERIFGLGEHQHGYLDQKGTSIDLYHHNTEFIIPFYVSSKKYGFLWHNPAIGHVELAKNRTVWEAQNAKQFDYWVTAGDTYARILDQYTEVTGKSPQMPEWGAGFWQSKLRYKSQQEIEQVAMDYVERNLPLSVMVVDVGHWTERGDFKFDPSNWPEPGAMVKKLRDNGIQTMVSVWPTIDPDSENFADLQDKGLLLRNKSGFDETQRFLFKNVADEHQMTSSKVRSYVAYLDPTHPEARAFLWDRLKRNYYDYGIKIFWLDCDEPELKHFDYHNLRYYLGDGDEVTSLYPNMSAKAVADGMKSIGETDYMTLSRAGWAGIQRYGAAVWSGDIGATFEVLKKQIVAGLNVAMSGVPWWNSDIGGFFCSDTLRKTEYYRELLVRWFQFGVFSPICRLHGHRDPNEIWTFGDTVYEILKKYLVLRQQMIPYILEQMDKAHQTGTPPMRPLFFDFDKDTVCLNIDDQYMFGKDIMVAPVTEHEARKRKVYFPAGVDWHNVWTGEVHAGGSHVEVDAPLDQIPLFSPTTGTNPLSEIIRK